MVGASTQDAELVAILAGRRAAGAVASVHRLLESTPEQLARLGLGPCEVHRVLACAELARRFQPSVETVDGVTTARRALPYFRALRRSRRELLAVMHLDRRLVPIGVRVVATGGAAGVAVGPRDVLEPALAAAAAAIILAHNHPSGDPLPSHEDVTFTRRLGDAAAAVAIDLVDHLIVARRGYASLRETGLWP